MYLLLRRCHLPCVFAGMVLLLFSACKRPETALRERPLEKIELVQKVEGMTPPEERALLDQLALGFGISSEPPDDPSRVVRVFRITLKGTPNPNTGRGLGKTWLVSTGSGALVGLLAPALGFTTWATLRSALIATAAGGMAGFAYGPIWYRNNQALLNGKGYLPWHFTAEWEVVDRGPGPREKSVASSGRPFLPHTPTLDLKPHLQPLLGAPPTEAEIRQASLRAYGEALVKHFKGKP